MSKAGKARRSVTLKVIDDQKIRVDVFCGEIRVAILDGELSQAYAYLTAPQALRLRAALDEVIEAEAQAKKGAGR